MRYAYISLMILAALLSACSVGPDFMAPEAPAAKTYTADGEAIASGQHVELGKRLAAEWWTLFASQPLNDVITQAMAGNNDIAAAKETLAQAEEAVKAENGGRLPQVSLGASAVRQKYGVALFGPSDFSIPPFAAYEAGPSLAWGIDVFGGTRRRVERQEALADYRSHELDAAYVALTGNVVAQSLEIAAAKAEIATTQQIIAEDEKNLKLVQTALQAGAETKVDVLSAQSQLDNDKALIPPLQQRQSVAQHALSILVGKAPADWSPPEFALDAFTLPQELPTVLPSELVRKRPDILAAEANLHAASATIGVATANLYPKITLTANTMQEALTPRNIFMGSSNAWALAGGITAPVFSGGMLSAEKREAEHAYQAALAQYKQTILHAFGQVADALTALRHDADDVAAQQRAVDTAGAALRLARLSYEAGNAGLLQIQDAQRQLSRASLGLIRAQSRRYMDTAQLFVALGGSPLTGAPKP